MTTQHPVPAMPDFDSLGAPPSGSRRARQRLRAGLWPWVPALLLVSLIGTQLVVLSSVLDDPAFAAEPDYYRKALDWDAQQGRARQSQALGWTARASAEGATLAERALVLAIIDAHGAAVGGADVLATAFPNARAGQARELSFREASPGIYRAELGAARAGLWELRYAASRGQQRFTSTLRFEIEDSGNAP